jgi:hypothetical protein
MWVFFGAYPEEPAAATWRLPASMRNLAISSVVTWVLPESVTADPPQSRDASVAFDVDEKYAYCAIERASSGSSRTPPKVTLVKVQAGFLSVSPFLRRGISSDRGQPLFSVGKRDPCVCFNRADSRYIS